METGGRRQYHCFSLGTSHPKRTWTWLQDPSSRPTVACHGGGRLGTSLGRPPLPAKPPMKPQLHELNLTVCQLLIGIEMLSYIPKEYWCYKQYFMGLQALPCLKETWNRFSLDFKTFKSAWHNREGPGLGARSHTPTLSPCWYLRLFLLPQ